MSRDLAGMADLVEKYDLLAALAEGTPGRTPERRRAMQTIAQKFPAALREVEQMSRQELGRRSRVTVGLLQKLVTQVERSSSWQRWHSHDLLWARVLVDVHRRLRDLLDQVVVMPKGRKKARAIAGDGRRSRRVYEEIAASQGLTPDALRQLIFPHSAQAANAPISVNPQEKTS